MNLDEIIEYLASPNDLSSAMASLELEFIKQNQNRYAEGIIVPIPFPTGIGKTFASTSVMAIIAATNHKLREDGEFLIDEDTTDLKLASRTLFTCPSRKLVEEGYQGILQKYEDLLKKKLINKKEHATLLSRTIKMEKKTFVAQEFIRRQHEVVAKFARLGLKVDPTSSLYAEYTKVFKRARTLEKQLTELEVRHDRHGNFDARKLMQEKIKTIRAEAEPYFSQSYNLFSSLLEAEVLKHDPRKNEDGVSERSTIINRVIDGIDKDELLRALYADTLLSWDRIDVVITTIHKAYYDTKVFLGGIQNLMWGGKQVLYTGNVIIDEFDTSKKILNDLIFRNIPSIDNLRGVHMLIAQLTVDDAGVEELIDDEAKEIIQESVGAKLPRQFMGDEKLTELIADLISNCRNFYKNAKSSYPLVAPSMPSELPYASDLGTYHIFGPDTPERNQGINQYIVIDDEEEQRSIIKIVEDELIIPGSNTLIELISALENHMVFEVAMRLRSILEHVQTNYDNCRYQSDERLLKYIFTNIGGRTLNDSVFKWLSTALGYQPKRTTERVRIGTNPYTSLMMLMEITDLVDISLDRYRDCERAVSMTQSGTCAEALLLKTAHLNNIIGLSATASLPGYISNFDIRWLQEVLGDRVIELNDAQIDLAFQVYSAERRFEEEGIQVECSEAKLDTASDRYREMAVSRILEREQLDLASGHCMNTVDLTDRLYGELKNKYGKVTTAYNLSRLARTLRAIHGFLEPREHSKYGTVHSKSMLCFGNLKWSKWGEKELIELLIRELAEPLGKNPIVKFIYADTFDSIKERDFPTDEEPIIYITTYASAGTGVNLQFPKTDRVNGLVYIGSEERKANAKTFDIDTVYLERPTQVGYPSIGRASIEEGLDPHEEKKTRRSLQYQTLHNTNVLTQRCEIDILVGRDLGRACLNLDLPGDPDQYRKTDDYENGVFRIIRQALGRCGRTAWKLPIIKIMIDEELTEILVNDTFTVGADLERKRKTCGYEYIQLVNFCETQVEYNANVHIDRQSAIKEREKRAACQKSRSTLNGFLRIIKQTTRKKSETIRTYDTLRMELLKKPTADRNDPSNWQYLIHFDEPVRNYGFSYNLSSKHSSEGDFRQKASVADYFDAMKWSFDPVHRAKDRLPYSASVGEDQTPLPIFMQNEPLKAYFEEKGFATTWEPNTAIINPIWFPAYKGILGEEVFRYAVETYELGTIQEIPEEHFESYDFNINNIAVDVKSWSSYFANTMSTEVMVEKALEKLERTGMDKFVFVNVTSLGNVAPTDISSHHPDVSFVHGIFDAETGQINQDGLLAMQGVINRWGS